jgi:uncharacterized protein DUF4920
MLALTLAVMCVGAPATAADSAVARFGKPLKGLKPTPLSEVLESPKDGDTVRLEGKAETVCKNKGCWVTVRDGNASVHVTFEGYSFFIPKDSAGKKVALEGKVKVKATDPAEVAHLKGEGAGRAASSRVSVEAYGVELRDASTR